MNKFFRYSYTLLIASVALTMGSCTEEDEYTPAEAVQNAKAVVLADQTSYYFEGAVETQQFNFYVHRPDSTDAATIALVSDDIIDVPATVDFAAGEGTKQLTATAAIEKGQKVQVTIAVADADANLYSPNKNLVVTLERDRYAWVTCGKALFTDLAFQDDATAVGEAEIQRCEGVDEKGNVVKNRYKLVQPLLNFYGEGEGDIKFDLDDKGNPVDIITDGGVICSLAGYDYYYNTASYAAYCSFEKENGVYIINCLLKRGTSLYLGGLIYFQWAEGYPY